MRKVRRPEVMTPEKRLYITTRAWELRTREGLGYRAIAARLTNEGYKCSYQTVRRYLTDFTNELGQELRGSADGLRLQQTASYQLLFREAMSGWEKSKEPAKRALKEERSTGDAAGKDGEGRKLLTVTRSEAAERPGDARFLKQAQDALEAVDRLWGLSAPARTDVTVSPGPAPGAIEAGSYDDEATAARLDAIFGVLAEAGQLPEGLFSGPVDSTAHLIHSEDTD